MHTVAWYGFVSPFDHHPHTMQAGAATNGTLRARAAPTLVHGAELVEDGHHAYVQTGNICINIAIMYTCVRCACVQPNWMMFDVTASHLNSWKMATMRTLLT